MKGKNGIDIKWEIAFYLIEAKKAVDSLWYISNHVGELYDVGQLCNDRRSQYYINTCAVLDKTVCDGKGKKKELTQNDNVIAHIYYERDKHYAHKDSDYKQNYPWTNLEQEAFALQEELRHILEKCKDYTDDSFTKKKLSQRFAKLSDGTVVQRDLYSAFLLLHLRKNLQSYNKKTIKKDFPQFKMLHDKTKERLQNSHEWLPCSVGF